MSNELEINRRRHRPRPPGRLARQFINGEPRVVHELRRTYQIGMARRAAELEQEAALNRQRRHEARAQRRAQQERQDDEEEELVAQEVAAPNREGFAMRFGGRIEARDVLEDGQREERQNEGEQEAGPSNQPIEELNVRDDAEQQAELALNQEIVREAAEQRPEARQAERHIRIQRQRPRALREPNDPNEIREQLAARLREQHERDREQARQREQEIQRNRATLFRQLFGVTLNEGEAALDDYLRRARDEERERNAAEERQLDEDFERHVLRVQEAQQRNADNRRRVRIYRNRGLRLDVEDEVVDLRQPSPVRDPAIVERRRLLRSFIEEYAPPPPVEREPPVRVVERGPPAHREAEINHENQHRLQVQDGRLVVAPVGAAPQAAIRVEPVGAPRREYRRQQDELELGLERAQQQIELAYQARANNAASMQAQLDRIRAENAALLEQLAATPFYQNPWLRKFGTRTITLMDTLQAVVRSQYSRNLRVLWVIRILRVHIPDDPKRERVSWRAAVFELREEKERLSLNNREEFERKREGFCMTSQDLEARNYKRVSWEKQKHGRRASHQRQKVQQPRKWGKC